MIAPDAGGPRDLVISGTTGMLVRPDNARDLAAAVTVLAADKPTRSQLAAVARPSVVDRSWELIGEELVGHYREVLAAATTELAGAEVA